MLNSLLGLSATLPLLLACPPTSPTAMIGGQPAGALTQALPARTSEQEDLFAQLRLQLGESVQRGDYRGVVAVVEIEGERLLADCLGLQNQGTRVAMRLDTIFRIYSMSKPVTVVAALLLMEAGKLSLDDAVSKYLPQLGGLGVGLAREPVQREMSVRDLMRHTSGLTYGIFAKSEVDTLVAAANLLDPALSLEELVTKLAELPLKHQPGTSFEYSLSIDVLGRLVEVVAEQPLAAFMQERIFEPLGMLDTGFYVPAAKLSRLADLNARVQGKLVVLPEQPSPTELPRLQSGGGGLFSSAEDYLSFARMLLNGGEHEGRAFLKQESVALMTQNQMLGISKSYPFGLGGSVVQRESETGPGLRTYAWGGYAGTYFWFDPSEGIAAVFMIQNMTESNYGSSFQQSVYRSIGR